ncbi:MAG: serine hydrolase [Cutibacterium avidum]|nr:serine hydrolase [Cutibacterium avidum]
MKLRNMVQEDILHDIANGTLRPGDWIPEEALASKLGVSRTPVREAIRALASVGVLESVSNRGTRVAPAAGKDGGETETGQPLAPTDNPTVTLSLTMDQARDLLRPLADGSRPTDSEDSPESAPRRTASPAQGVCAPRFVAVKNLFQDFLDADPDFSAQVAVYLHGSEVVNLWGGPHLTDRSVTGVYSVSKGIAGLVIGHLYQEGMFSFDDTVCTYWPEFAAKGKEQITLRQLFTHQAGIVGVEPPFSVDECADTRKAAQRLAETTPSWVPGTAFGYHQRTVGIALEELVRRWTGQELREVYDSVLREPYGIDFFFGLPASQEARYVPLQPTPNPAPSEPCHRASWRGIASNVGGESLAFPTNVEKIRATGICSSGGVGSASGLARAYASAMDGVDGKPALLSAETITTMSRQQVWGIDRVLDIISGFGIIFQKPANWLPFGGQWAFGHDGAGGALAFADPATGLTFGYIPCPNESSFGERRVMPLVRRMYEAVGAM